jgi:glutamate formiminotransferase/formiminotetrahydrofolate cyclodeaminase
MLMEKDQKKNKDLADLTVKDFAFETSRESPAPGGGTISAYMGALGAALGTMVANLSGHKAGWDDRWEEFARHADKGQTLMSQLIGLVDEDTQAFNRIMEAFGLPKKTDADKATRSAAIQTATLYAAEVPLRTMRTASEVFALCHDMAETGNPNSVSDAGVGALAARAAVLGAGLNVKINAASLKDRDKAAQLIGEAEQLMCRADEEERQIMAIVEKVINAQ